MSLIFKPSLRGTLILDISYLTIVNTKEGSQSPIKIFGEAPIRNSIAENISVVFHEEYFFNPECLTWTSNPSFGNDNDDCDVFNAEQNFSLKNALNLRRKQNFKLSRSSEILQKSKKLILDGEFHLNLNSHGTR